MLNKIYKISGLMITSFLPFVAYAQAPLDKTRGLLSATKNIVTDILIPLAFVLALLFFFWGVARYILAVGSDGKEEGRKIMIWGVVALFVMSSVWGLVYFIGGELGVGTEISAPVPGIGLTDDNGN